jgi:hypothetical protein
MRCPQWQSIVAGVADRPTAFSAECRLAMTEKENIGWLKIFSPISEKLSNVFFLLQEL